MCLYKDISILYNKGKNFKIKQKIMYLCIINILKIYFIINSENDVLYLALKSTRTVYTVTSLNKSKKPKKTRFFWKRIQ